MQQRQLRLGDILDDYCPRERRVTNHAVVAMVGQDVKQTRCTTCEAEHEYKEAKVPRQRRKSDTPAALYTQVLANGPKRVVHEAPVDGGAPGETAPSEPPASTPAAARAAAPEPPAAAPLRDGDDESAADAGRPLDDLEDGPVHRPLIRATLPRTEGQPPPTRPAPEFTIRQPGGRQNRFRPRHTRGGQPFQGDRSNGNMGGGPPRGGRPRQGGMPRLARRHGPPGHKRSK